MRKSKIINIEGPGEVTVKEVSPYAVYQALAKENKTEEIQALVLDCISLDKEKLQKLYPSEIEELVDAFLEVNNSFLAIAGKLGIKGTLTGIRDEIGKTLPQMFVDSYKTVMAKLPGSMAGAAS